jgi:hypothetical protein
MKFFDIYYLLLIILLIGCNSGIKDGTELKLIENTFEEVKSKYGEPDDFKEVILVNGISLYEYQSSLYKYMPINKKESLEVKELRYLTKSNKKNLVIWLVRKDDTLRVIDALEW